MDKKPMTTLQKNVIMAAALLATGIAGFWTGQKGSPAQRDYYTLEVMPLGNVLREYRLNTTTGETWVHLFGAGKQTPWRKIEEPLE